MEEQAQSWLELAEKHGPWMIFAVVGAYCLVALIKFILKHLIDQIKAERQSGQKKDDIHIEAMREHTNTLKLISETNKEAHTHQRAEHGTMIGILQKIEENQNNHKTEILTEIRREQ